MHTPHPTSCCFTNNNPSSPEVQFQDKCLAFLLPHPSTLKDARAQRALGALSPVVRGYPRPACRHGLYVPLGDGAEKK